MLLYRFNNKKLKQIVKHGNLSIQQQNVSTYPSFNYEFIDCGNFKRLEKFADTLVIRSCPTSYWKKSINIKEWNFKNILEYDHKNKKWKNTNINEIENTNWIVKFGPNISLSLAPKENGQIGKNICILYYLILKYNIMA
jgi:hypothetical protein